MMRLNNELLNYSQGTRVQNIQCTINYTKRRKHTKLWQILEICSGELKLKALGVHIHEPGYRCILSRSSCMYVIHCNEMCT